MYFGVHIQAWGAYADVHALAQLAHEAEAAGWDGFFISDHLTTPWHLPVADPWVALTAIALATHHVRFGPLVTPLPRHRPWGIARAAVTLDHLSAGRFVLGVGSGGLPHEFDHVGDEADPRRRAEMLDEDLAIITRLWHGQPMTYQGVHYTLSEAHFLPVPVQQLRIPIWVAGTWPHRAPFRRAARWNGVYPVSKSMRSWADRTMLPEEVQAMLAYTSAQREQQTPFEVVVAGHTAMPLSLDEAAVLAGYAASGVTWWLEHLTPPAFGRNWADPWPTEAFRARVQAGPPRG
jgi:alkanesulfonate monooxygenase SsuD/methylene tetrahydromethanopterin reductase-like flavin-dependent oxidoreductase (luciferase family)